LRITMHAHWRFRPIYWRRLRGQLLPRAAKLGGGERFRHRHAHRLWLPDLVGDGWHAEIGSAQARWWMDPSVGARRRIRDQFGEMLEMWTQKRVVATPHRVVGGDAERMSIPLFYNPNAETNVAPIGSDQVIRAVDHLQKRFDETYLHLKDAS
jgi:hypothetical protein